MLRRISILRVMFLVAMLFLSGCGPASGWVPPTSLPPTTSSAQPERVDNFRRLDFDAVPELSLKPAWTKRYNASLYSALSPEGDLVAVYGQFPNKGLGFTIFDRAGKQSWQYSFEDKSLVSTEVKMGGPGIVTAVAYDRSQKGHAYAFGRRGSQLWQRAVDGATTITTSDDGQRFLLLNPVSQSLQLLNRDNRALADLSITPEATAQFINDNNLVLINDLDGVKLLDGSGKELWTHKVDRDLKRSVILSGDTRYIAITTTGRDSSVYVFDTRGRLRWGRQLPLGGTNQPLFAAESDILYVYNVAGNAGVYTFEADSGNLIWRTMFDGRRAKRAAITGFWPGEHVLTWDYLMERADNSHDHWLVMQNRSGSGLHKYHLGQEAVVQGSADGRFLLVTQSDPDFDPKGTTVKLFDLSQATPPED